MFVHKYKSGKHVYVRLVEGTRVNGKVKITVLENFGRLDKLIEEDPLAYEKLQAKYNSERAAKEELTSQQRASLIQKTIAVTPQEPKYDDGLAPLHYGHYPLRRIWNQMLRMPAKFEYIQRASPCTFDWEGIISFLTFTKVLDPGSVLFTFSSRERFLGNPIADVPLEHAYKALTKIYEHKDELFKWVNLQMDKHYGPERCSMLLYDVTNAYFETPLSDKEKGLVQEDFQDKLMEAVSEAVADGVLSKDACFDEYGALQVDKIPEDFLDELAAKGIEFLRMRGPSKEKRFDMPIVSVALILDRNGFPVDFEVFAGNRSEFNSMKEAIDQLAKKHNVEDTVLVADRGLNSADNLKMLTDKKMGFLIAQKITNLDKGIMASMLDNRGYQPINPANPDAARYKVIEDFTKNAGAEEVKCSLVLTFDETRYKRDLAVLDLWKAMVELKAKKKVKLDRRKTGWAALAKTAEGPDDKKSVARSCEIVGVDKAKYEEKKKLCGYAAMVWKAPLCSDEVESSDAPSNKLSGAEIACLYKKLNLIEDRFRIMKSNLCLRPMFVRKSSRIKGHVTVCVLALLLSQILLSKLKADQKMSVSQMTRTLRNAAVVVGKNANGALIFSRLRGASVLNDPRNIKTQERVIEEIKSGKKPTLQMKWLLEAVGLSWPAKHTSRAELAKALGTRFKTDEEAVNGTVLALI